MKRIFLALAIIVSAAHCIAQGTYVEFKITSADGISGTTKTYAQDGNTRTEAAMVVPSMPGGGMTVITMTKKATPNTIYILNDQNKTYMENTTGSDNTSHDSKEYEVTVLGKETVNGYNCTHVKINIKGDTKSQELWTTTAVANYEKFRANSSKYTTETMYKALAEKGAAGFPVRMKAFERGHSVQIDMVKSEVRSNPSSLFSLDGYTKSAAATVPPSGRVGPDPDMIKKMQNMTPEERQKMIDDLKKQYGKQ